jgi:hypothetical protein
LEFGGDFMLAGPVGSEVEPSNAIHQPELEPDGAELVADFISTITLPVEPALLN